MMIFVDYTNTITPGDREKWRQDLLSNQDDWGVPDLGRGICASTGEPATHYCRDRMEIVPIHANTGSAAPFVSLDFLGEGTRVEYTRSYRGRTLRQMRKFRDTLQTATWPLSDSSRVATDVFSAFARAADSPMMAVEGGVEVRRVLVLYSDMLHEHGTASLSEFYEELALESVREKAQNKANNDAQWFDADNLKGIEVYIRTPSNHDGESPLSDPMYRRAASVFWKIYVHELDMEWKGWELI